MYRSELNSELTVDLSNTSLSPTTDFNSLIQMMAEKLYPNYVWNGIANPSILGANAFSGYVTPSFSITDNKLVCVTPSSPNTGGHIYVSPQTEQLTLHIKGTYYNGDSSDASIDYCDSYNSSGTEVGSTLLISLPQGVTTSFDNTFIIPSGKYVSIGVARNSNISIDEFWAG